jgi:hypothetical protein
MSYTIKITDDVSLVLSDRLMGTLVIVPRKTGKRNKFRRLAIMRYNLIMAARVLSRESRRHKPFIDIDSAKVYKDLSA